MRASAKQQQSTLPDSIACVGLLPVGQAFTVTDATPHCERLIPTSNAALWWPYKYRNGASPERQSPHNVSDVWAMTLCRRASHHRATCPQCHVVVHLQRILGCDAASSTVNFTHDGDTAAMGRQRFGPDELHLLLEGPEHLSGRPRYLGDCTYQYSVHVTIPGKYRLFVVGQRADWGGLHETTPGFQGRTCCTIPEHCTFRGCWVHTRVL